MSQTPSHLELELAAEHREFPRLQTFVEAACAEAGCSDRQRLRVMLVMEELFTNTVKYGQAGPAAVSITVSMQFDGTQPMTIRYEDDGPPHDPFEQSGPADELNASLTRRRIGGLGIVLVRELGNDVSYAHRNGRNCVTFAVPLAPPPRYY
jgi:serine/threonine-protein kinase RsbW